ncbi:hypothetical protein NDU88_002886 [Pleurodeles waltl]|uniref:Uncharacterized protein n=1 Tax=Pleurodeles waltl TaxID=8319 RepID=A0AAV7VCK1_PLEWA|nr:hypothetical protein NDU88_002886 [Pleurodeles waltl]
MQNAHAPHISRARRRVAMVARAAPRGQEETVEGRTLAHSGNSPRTERNRWKARAESAARLQLRWRFRFPTLHRVRLRRVNHHQEAAIRLHLLQV